MFVLGKGYGYDTVGATDSTAKRHDKKRLVGLTRDEVEFIAETVLNGNTIRNNNFVVRIKETGETMTVINGLVMNSNSSSTTGIQSIEFGDGTSMSWDEIRLSGLHGTDGDDVITLPQYTNATVYGGAGDDIITGGNYDDSLYGGYGDDKLYGGLGDGIHDGGDGNDHPVGGV